MILLVKIVYVAASLAPFALAARSIERGPIFFMAAGGPLLLMFPYALWFHFPGIVTALGMSSAEAAAQTTWAAMAIALVSIASAYSVAHLSQEAVSRVEVGLQSSKFRSATGLATRFVLCLAAALSITFSTAAAKTTLMHLGIGMYAAAPELDDIFAREREEREEIAARTLEACNSLGQLVEAKRDHPLTRHFSNWWLITGREYFVHLPSTWITTRTASSQVPEVITSLTYEAPDGTHCEMLLHEDLANSIHRDRNVAVVELATTVQKRTSELETSVHANEFRAISVYSFAVSDLAQFFGVSWLSLEPTDISARVVNVVGALVNLILSVHVLYLIGRDAVSARTL